MMTALAGHIRTIDEDGKQRTFGDFAALETEQTPTGQTATASGTCRTGARRNCPPIAASIHRRSRLPSVRDRPLRPHDLRGRCRGQQRGLRGPRTGKTETVAVLPPQPYRITAEAAASNDLPDCVVGRPMPLNPSRRTSRSGPTAGCTSPRSRADRRIRRSAPAGPSTRSTRTTARLSSWLTTSCPPPGWHWTTTATFTSRRCSATACSRIDGDRANRQWCCRRLHGRRRPPGDTLYATVNALPGPEGPPDGKLVSWT